MTVLDAIGGLVAAGAFWVVVAAAVTKPGRDRQLTVAWGLVNALGVGLILL